MLCNILSDCIFTLDSCGIYACSGSNSSNIFSWPDTAAGADCLLCGVGSSMLNGYNKPACSNAFTGSDCVQTIVSRCVSLSDCAPLGGVALHIFWCQLAYCLPNMDSTLPQVCSSLSSFQEALYVTSPSRQLCSASFGMLVCSVAQSPPYGFGSLQSHQLPCNNIALSASNRLVVDHNSFHQVGPLIPRLQRHSFRLRLSGPLPCIIITCLVQVQVQTQVSSEEAIVNIVPIFMSSDSLTWS